MADNKILFSRQLVHPVVLISVSDGDKENIATMAWVMSVSSDPPLLIVAVSPKRYSHDLILKAGEFGIMVLTDQQKELSTIAGTSSGEETNKWELEPFRCLRKQASIIKAPLLKNCLAVYECKLVNHVRTGDHTLFIGEILYSDVNENLQPLILFDRKYFKIGDFISCYP